jgi:hypothetical protein
MTRIRYIGITPYTFYIGSVKYIMETNDIIDVDINKIKPSKLRYFILASGESLILMVSKNSGTPVGARPELNFIEGDGILIDVTDDGQDDEIDITISASGGGGSHASTHQDGGADEINVGGLSGDLADEQDAKAHNLGGATHNQDTLANLNNKISDATLDDSSSTRTPSAHATSHELGGSDEIDVTGLQGAGVGGGLVDKAGEVTTDGSGEAVVTFNTNYGDTDYFIQLTAIQNSDTSVCMVKQGTKTVSGFTVKVEDDGGKNEASVVVMWATGEYSNP